MAKPQVFMQYVLWKKYINYHFGQLCHNMSGLKINSLAVAAAVASAL